MKEIKEAVVDRRIQKTKRALSEALIQLVIERGYEKVTIQDIIDTANVGRSTFYSHYENKEQLLLDGPNNLNIPLFMDAREEFGFEKLFDHIDENRQLAKAMLGKRGGNMMEVFLTNNIALMIKKNFSKQFETHKSGQLLLKFLSDAAAAGVVSLLISWIENEPRFTKSEIAGHCQKMVEGIFFDKKY